MHKNKNPKTLFHTNHEKSTKLLWNKKWWDWEGWRTNTRDLEKGRKNKAKRINAILKWIDPSHNDNARIELKLFEVSVNCSLPLKIFSVGILRSTILRVRRKRCRVEETHEWRVRGKGVIW
jgi:hypothetical protein